MPRPLLVYGTLRDSDLLAAALGRRLRLHGVLNVRAPSFRAAFYPGRTSAALIRAPGMAAEGLLLTDLSAFERDLRDAFGGTQYRRQVVPVMIEVELHDADVYLPTIAMPSGALGWALLVWQANHKSEAIVAETARAVRLRSALLARRPH